MSMIGVSESLLRKPTHPPEKFEKLLRGPVSNADRTEVMKYLRDTERDYRDGQVEINKYKAMILMLESKREGMKKAMEKYRTLLSPVHRLPSELLSKIFGYCCKYNFLDLAMPPASSLSMVCGRWREIALLSPSLWSSIYILGLPTSDEEDEEGVDEEEERMKRDCITNRVRLCLERSKSAPLKLDITIYSSHYSSEGCSLSNTVMRLLAEHSERWEEFSYKGPECYASSAADRTHFPILRSLRLLTGPAQSGSHDQDPSLPLDRFRNCPALTSVYTDTVETEDRLQLPWASIRVLGLCDCSDASVLTILPSCLTLEELTLSEVYDTVNQTSPQRMIVSDTIRTLSIFAPYDDSVPNIQHFTFPRLSSINISHPATSPIHLQQLIQRSSCSITSLSLDGLRLTDSQLTSLLRLMPELRTLEIGICEGYPIARSRFLDHLTANPNDGHHLFLLHLTELKIEFAGEEVDEQSLTNALTSRLVPFASSPMGVDCLQSVEIWFWWDFTIPSEAFSSLQFLRDIGLQLTISHRIFNGW
ncbi:hypothetical protein D9758_002404 [Tetrapyrgos nigripes]|uniref:F-box domain-containing protein n=1 Tax=Tetrapyrgos nigripes TaxID=182062 RepID=A0A8H5GNQ9_9AGAR|nr:hypothetical protein D9758_002404 [Tetrapyrgos nigripes]